MQAHMQVVCKPKSAAGSRSVHTRAPGCAHIIFFKHVQVRGRIQRMNALERPYAATTGLMTSVQRLLRK